MWEISRGCTQCTHRLGTPVEATVQRYIPFFSRPLNSGFIQTGLTHKQHEQPSFRRGRTRTPFTVASCADPDAPKLKRSADVLASTALIVHTLSRCNSLACCRHSLAWAHCTIEGAIPQHAASGECAQFIFYMQCAVAGAGTRVGSSFLTLDPYPLSTAPRGCQKQATS